MTRVDSLNCFLFSEICYALNKATGTHMRPQHLKIIKTFAMVAYIRPGKRDNVKI